MPPKRAGAEGSVAKAKPTKKRRAADTDPPATAPKQKGKTAIADVEDAWHAPSFSADEVRVGVNLTDRHFQQSMSQKITYNKKC